MLVNGLSRSPGAQRSGQKIVLHLMCLIYFSRVCLWHLSDDAKALPGATGFGWFFKYFTICSFAAQTIQFFVCAVDDALWQAERPLLRTITDSFSCTMFSMANTVTFMFFMMSYLTAGKAEVPSAHRPPWLGPSVHIYNAVAAWADILVSDNRTFSPGSLRLCISFAFVYAGWLLIVAHQNGAFPYPFLNPPARQPHTFATMVVACLLCMVTWFIVGKVCRKGLVKMWDKVSGWHDARVSKAMKAQ